MGQGCSYYFVVTLDQKAIATNKTNASLKVISNKPIANNMTSFFDLQFFKVLCTIEENLWHIWNPEEILSKTHVLFMQKYKVRRKFDLFGPELDLTSIKSQVG